MMAMVYAKQSLWLARQSILAKRGATGNWAMVRPSDVMRRTGAAPTWSLSLSLFRASSWRETQWNPMLESHVLPQSHLSVNTTPTLIAAGLGGVGKGKLATLSMLRAFICSTRSSTGRWQISGSENSQNSWWNTVDENNLMQGTIQQRKRERERANQKEELQLIKMTRNNISCISQLPRHAHKLTYSSDQALFFRPYQLSDWPMPWRPNPHEM